jgi:hypothetical protein
VLCYLLSHAVSHSVPEARISIMTSVMEVTDAAKSDMVIPVMETLTKDPTPVSNLFGVNFPQYNALVASTFLSVSTINLNAGSDNSVWEIFGLALRTYFQPSKNFLCYSGGGLTAFRCEYYCQTTVFRRVGREVFCAFGHGTPGSSLRRPIVGRIVRQ